MRVRGLLALAAAATFACNAIVGVEDVRLRRADTVTPEDDADVETGPQPDGGAAPDVVEVALGSDHSCARTPDGQVRCWGNNRSGQIGSGVADEFVAKAALVSLKNVLHIDAGNNHTCAVLRDGTAACWGFNLDGQLGNGLRNDQSNIPVAVLNLSDAIGIAAGSNFSCALRSGGGVACWGTNINGQLGDGTASDRPTAAPVLNITDAIAVAAGEAHACAVLGSHRLMCWGDNKVGQLGTGAFTESPVPDLVPLEGVTAISLGARSTCALTEAGLVYCWGANEQGQLGRNPNLTSDNKPNAPVSDLERASSIGVGASHACAVIATGQVRCWGAGGSGQLGDGLQRDPDAGASVASPVTVALSSAMRVSAGGRHTCAVLPSGAISCWGANNLGQLGTGTATEMEPSPAIPVTGIP